MKNILIYTIFCYFFLLMSAPSASAATNMINLQEPDDRRIQVVTKRVVTTIRDGQKRIVRNIRTVTNEPIWSRPGNQINPPLEWVLPSPVPSPKPSPTPPSDKPDCSPVRDDLCPSKCGRRNDFDCCEQKSRYHWKNGSCQLKEQPDEINEVVDIIYSPDKPQDEINYNVYCFQVKDTESRDSIFDRIEKSFSRGSVMEIN
jgi:hypothetical protein